MRVSNINKSILIGEWCLISLLFGLMYYYSPLLCEDLHFQVLYRLFNDGESGFSLDGWLAFINDIRNYDNSRLANILTFFSTIWKPFNYLFPWFTGMAVASIIFMVVKYGLGKQSTWSSIGIMWIAIAVITFSVQKSPQEGLS